MSSLRALYIDALSICRERGLVGTTRGAELELQLVEDPEVRWNRPVMPQGVTARCVDSKCVDGGVVVAVSGRNSVWVGEFGIGEGGMGLKWEQEGCFLDECGRSLAVRVFGGSGDMKVVVVTTGRYLVEFGILEGRMEVVESKRFGVEGGLLFSASIEGEEEVRTVLFGSAGGEFGVWDSKSGENCVGEDVKGTVFAVAMDAGGKRVVSGGDEWSVDRWDVLDDGSLSRKWRGYGHHGRIWSLCVEKRWIVSGGEDACVGVWDDESDGVCVRMVRAHAHRHVRCVASLGGELFCSAGADGVIRLWNMPDGERVLDVRDEREWAENAPTMRLDLNGAVEQLRERAGFDILGDTDEKYQEIDVSKLSKKAAAKHRRRLQQRKEQVPAGPCRAAGADPSGSHVVSVFSDGSVVETDLADGTSLGIVHLGACSEADVQWDGEEKALWVACGAESLKVFVRGKEDAVGEWRFRDDFRIALVKLLPGLARGSGMVVATVPRESGRLVLLRCLVEMERVDFEVICEVGLPNEWPSVVNVCAAGNILAAVRGRGAMCAWRLDKDTLRVDEESVVSWNPGTGSSVFSFEAETWEDGVIVKKCSVGDPAPLRYFLVGDGEDMGRLKVCLLAPGNAPLDIVATIATNSVYGFGMSIHRLHIWRNEDCPCVEVMNLPGPPKMTIPIAILPSDGESQSAAPIRLARRPPHFLVGYVNATRTTTELVFSTFAPSRTLPTVAGPSHGYVGTGAVLKRGESGAVWMLTSGEDVRVVARRVMERDGVLVRDPAGVRSLTGPVGPVRSLAARGSLIVAGEREGRIVVWRDWEQLQVLHVHEDRPNAVFFVGDERLVVGSSTGEVSMVDVSSGSVLHTLSSPSVVLCGTSTLSVFAIGYSNGSIEVYSHDFKELYRASVHAAGVNDICAAESDDGQHLTVVTVGDDEAIGVCRATLDETKLSWIWTDFQMIHGLCTASGRGIWTDGTLVFVSCADGMLRVLQIMEHVHPTDPSTPFKKSPPPLDVSSPPSLDPSIPRDDQLHPDLELDLAGLKLLATIPFEVGDPEGFDVLPSSSGHFILIHGHGTQLIHFP